MVTCTILAVVFLVSSFKGEGADSEEGSCKFTYLHFDLGASCQPQWHHSTLQGTLPCGEEGVRLMSYIGMQREIEEYKVMKRQPYRMQQRGRVHVTLSCGAAMPILYAVQVYSNNSEVATLYPTQTSFTFTGLTPSTLYLMSVGAFTDAGEGEREERMVLTDSPTDPPGGMSHITCGACK